MMILTHRFRIKDATTGKHLDAHARAVNRVWNYCCEAQRHAQKWRSKWPSWVDLCRLTQGSAPLLGLHSDTVSQICRRFAQSRNGKGRCPKWRSNAKNLGWIPVRTRTVTLSPDAIKYKGRVYRFWASRTMAGPPEAVSFACDALGRWYVNIGVEVPVGEATGSGEVGIDLGLKTLATLSNGTTIENPRHFAKYEAALAGAQRAGNGRRAKAIHAKIHNARAHHLHEQSTRLVRTYQKIVVGDVSASSLAQTKMAKSVLDAGWSSFRNMLRYKAIRHGVEYVEASERNTTVTCSACGARSGPKGQKGLRIRQWACDACGVVHDRDQNAAVNILLAGSECRPPVEGIA